MTRRSTAHQLAAAKETGAVARVAGEIWALSDAQRQALADASPELLDALDVLAEEHRRKMAIAVRPLHA